MLVLAISCHRFLWFFAARADNANYGNDYQQGDTPSYRAYYDNQNVFLAVFGRGGYSFTGLVGVTYIAGLNDSCGICFVVDRHLIIR